MGDLLTACVAATGSDARLVWLPPEEILAAGVAPWTELPVWLPPGPDHDAMHGSDTAKARAAGLACQPVAETVRDTWAWLQGLGGFAPQRPDRPRVGLPPEVESRLLGGLRRSPSDTG